MAPPIRSLEQAEPRVTPGIVIVGPHRTGLTLFARLAALWGAMPGGDPEQVFLPPDRSHPAGYWEERSVVALNDRLLRQVDAGFFVPPAPEAMPTLAQLSDGSEFAHEARTLMRPRFADDAGVWFLKDPRFAFLLPFWQEMWPDVLYVIPVRHPMSAARSLRARHHVPLSAGALSWYITMHLVLACTEGAPRIFVEYEGALRAPIKTCEHLWRILRFHTGRDGVTAPAQAGGVVQRELSHFHDQLFEGDHGLYEPVRDLYHRLRMLAAGSPDIAEAPPLPETTWRAVRDYLQLWSALQRLWHFLPDPERNAVIGTASVSERELFGF